MAENYRTCGNLPEHRLAGGMGWQRECDQDPTWAHQTDDGQGCESRGCHRLYVAAAGASGNEMKNDTGIMPSLSIDILRLPKLTARSIVSIGWGTAVGSA
jgi:hypothetical protein